MKMNHPRQVQEILRYRLNNLRLYTHEEDIARCITIDGDPQQDLIHLQYKLLGQEYFRSIAAQLLYTYHPADGKKQQQILGVALSRSRKEQFYDQQLFFKYVAYDTSYINIKYYKHHVVHAFLGFIATHCDKSDVEAFILKYWLNDAWQQDIRTSYDWGDIKKVVHNDLGIKLYKTIEKNPSGDHKYIGKLMDHHGNTLLETWANSFRYTDKKLNKSIVRWYKTKC